MYYLARNKEVIAEAREFLYPKRGLKFDNTSRVGASYTTLGSFPSKILGSEIFVGIKEYKPIDNDWKIDLRAPLELAVIASIAEYIPEIRKDLPKFYALLRNPDNRSIGILMEDFSKGGQVEVKNSLFVDPKIVALFGNDLLEEDYICNIGFIIEGEIKYGDFFPIYQFEKMDKALARHPMNKALRQVRRNMAHHTIRLDRNFI